MWIFTRRGFFSISCAWEKTGHQNSEKKILLNKLMIRARSKVQLKHLMEDYKLDVPLLESTHTDYKYRAIVDKDVFQQIMQNEVEKINYSNFKNSVCDMGCDNVNNVFLDALHDVWSVMDSFGRRLFS